MYTKIIQLAILFSLVPGFVHAMSVSPGKQVVSVDPGSEQIFSIDVKNTEDVEIAVRPRVTTFYLSESDGLPIFDESASIDWVRPLVETVTVAPGEIKKVFFDVRVPEDAESGSHYLGLFATSVPGEGQLGVSSEVGSLLFLHVAGEVQESLRIDVVTDDKYIKKKSGTIGLVVQNTGDIDVTPTGWVRVSDWRNNVLFHEKVHGTVLPESQRVQQVVFSGLSWSDIGPIDVRAQVVYGHTNQIAQTYIRLWYLPYEAMAIGFSVLVSLFCILFYVTKRNAL